MNIPNNEFIKGSFRRQLYAHRWLKLAGISLSMVGLLTICFLIISSQLYHKSLAILFIVASVIICIHAYIFWWGKPIGFTLHVMSSILYFMIGILSLYQYIHPITILCMSSILLVSYITMGLFRLKVSKIQQADNIRWRWTYLTAIINFLLATILFIFATIHTFDVIALTASIDILFTGFAIFMLGTTHATLKRAERIS